MQVSAISLLRCGMELDNINTKPLNHTWLPIFGTVATLLCKSETDG